MQSAAETQGKPLHLCYLCTHALGPFNGQSAHNADRKTAAENSAWFKRQCGFPMEINERFADFVRICMKKCHVNIPQGSFHTVVIGLKVFHVID